MTTQNTDPPRSMDPCYACPQLVNRPHVAPYCARGAHYGQVGCVRQPTPPRSARRG